MCVLPHRLLSFLCLAAQPARRKAANCLVLAVFHQRHPRLHASIVYVNSDNFSLRWCTTSTVKSPRYVSLGPVSSDSLQLVPSLGADSERGVLGVFREGVYKRAPYFVLQYSAGANDHDTIVESL